MIFVTQLNTVLYGIPRIVQAEHFGLVLSVVQGGRLIPPRFKLRHHCTAFQDGFIRVDGWIEHVAVVNDITKPFVLPRKHQHIKPLNFIADERKHSETKRDFFKMNLENW